MTTRSDRLAAGLAASLAREDSGEIVSAYLYGSHADARAHRESDVDVAILFGWDALPTTRERFERRVRLAGRLARDLSVRTVDLVVLNDVPPGLGRHVVTGGVRVYCSDPAADHAFVRDVQLRAADLEPFLRRTRRIKLGRLAR